MDKKKEVYIEAILAILAAIKAVEVMVIVIEISNSAVGIIHVGFGHFVHPQHDLEALYVLTLDRIHGSRTNNLVQYTRMLLDKPLLLVAPVEPPRKLLLEIEKVRGQWILLVAIIDVFVKISNRLQLVLLELTFGLIDLPHRLLDMGHVLQMLLIHSSRCLNYFYL